MAQIRAFPPTAGSSALPERIGNYPVLGVLGIGSMGVLYESVDPLSRRQIALKTVRRDLLAQDDAEQLTARLRIEARAAARLTHPGIVCVFDYGEDADHAFIVMERIQGRSLQSSLQENAPFDIQRTVKLISQLLEALQHAHEQGVWHRDVKPANIMLMNDGRLKLTDFGIAQIDSGGPSQLIAIMGSPGYIAPEAYMTDAFDHRIDIFAAGAVLYEMLTGTAPFVGTAEQVMIAVSYDTPPAPSFAGRQPSLVPFDTVVMQALARRPEDRFSSAAQFREALLKVWRSFRTA